MKPTRAVLEHGQSIWFDYIERKMLWDGSLYHMVREEGLRGVTSNPSIFEKAMGGADAYLPAMRQAVRRGASADEAFELLAVEDIQWACDVFRPVYLETGYDGLVSLEVSPHLAHDTIETIEEAHRLWEAVDRENLMIKVPGTREGLLAIEQLLFDGLNVNITLLFAVERYQSVLEGYLRALERRLQEGASVDRVASVASFFVSRIDSKVDQLLDAGVAEGRFDAAAADRVRGKTAIANARRAYRHYRQVTESDRWKRLAEAGAHPQRLLWASTSTKNPDYRDTLYVEELIGADTVDTVPAATYRAFNDHGRVEARLDRSDEEVLAGLEGLGLSLTEVAEELERDGVRLFAGAYDRLIGAVEGRRRTLLGPAIGTDAFEPDEGVRARLSRYQQTQVPKRLWARDGSLFAESEAEQAAAAAFMGWLDVVDTMAEASEGLQDWARELGEAGVDAVVLMGMGGSSLAPEVFRRTFERGPDAPELQVLDSTHPQAVQELVRRLEGKEAVFVVASKSGTTAEVKAFDDFFFDRVGRDPDEEEPGERFVAITDPDSPLERSAFERGFQGVFHGEPDVGGRFSALSPFGLVPAAALGVEPFELLERADRMIGSCRPAVPAEHNPAAQLAAFLAEAQAGGRDKLTVLTSPGLAAFGAWLEQLVAESLGKHGRGIVPVDGEPLGDASRYGADRVFLHLTLDGERDVHRGAAEGLSAAGHPVWTTVLHDRLDVVQEMFRWEMATAILGHEFGLDPFDQPDVQSSKDITKRLLAHLQAEGQLPEPEALVSVAGPDETGVVAVSDAAGAARLDGISGVEAALRAHVDGAEVPDYVGLLAFLPPSVSFEKKLRELQGAIRDRRRVATTVGFGPRYLHSTGQLHKGGPDRGVFVQLIDAPDGDLEIPGRNYGFGALCRAQALGDFLALSERGRRVLRIGLGRDPETTLDRLIGAVRS
jgi:transaldolase/glucose-6-phosphate isomerase